MNRFWDLERKKNNLKKNNHPINSINIAIYEIHIDQSIYRFIPFYLTGRKKKNPISLNLISSL